ncbi:MAG: HAMP domain-containing protein [Akkermansiaceae bacterium]|nr:HAMP domain-containing protein [Akkermansiaceae bacterium]
MRLPLYNRILLLFLLNVIVLGGALAWIAHRQLRHGLNTMLGAVVSNRIQMAAEKVYDELSASPKSQWPVILTNLEKSSGVKVGLFQMPNEYVLGSLPHMPQKVFDGLLPKMGGRPTRGREDQGMRHLPPSGPHGGSPDFSRRPPGRGEDGPPDRDGRPPNRQKPQSSTAQREFARGLVYDPDSKQYWAMSLMPPVFSDEPGPPDRLILAMVTRSVITCPLLFDARPWLWGIAASLLFSALLWLPFVRSITRRINQIVRVTQDISSGQFSTRLPEGRSDELGSLTSAVNQMADQLDQFIKGQRRFSGDVAHELSSTIRECKSPSGCCKMMS